MKNILLASTAMIAVAGAASAEITFSGKAEAGVYRSAPTAAVAAVVGTQSTWAQATTAKKTLTRTASTTAATATTIATQLTALNNKKAVLANKQALLNAAIAANTANATTTISAVNTAANAVALAQLDVAEAELDYAEQAGSAAVAKGAMPKSTAYSGYDFNVAASSTADNGMTFAIDFDMGAGLIADQDDDRAMDAQAADVAAGKLSMSYNGVTIAIKQDGIDDLYDDTQNGDVSVSGSFQGLSYTVVTDLDDDVAAVAATNGYLKAASTTGGAITTNGYAPAQYVAGTAATAAVYNPTSLSLGYTAGDLALSYVGTEHSDNGSAANKISATYTMGDMKVTVANDSKGDLKDVASISLAYSNGGMGVTLTVKDDANHALNTNKGGKQSQDIKVTYAAGALGFTAATDESSNWWVNAQYDLGGGAQAFTTLDHTDFAVVGVNFAF
jgi:outer membrane protein OmpU